MKLLTQAGHGDRRSVCDFLPPKGVPTLSEKESRRRRMCYSRMVVCSTISACLPPALATAAGASGPRGMHTPNKEICDAELCPRLSAPCIFFSLPRHSVFTATSQLSTRLCARRPCESCKTPAHTRALRHSGRGSRGEGCRRDELIKWRRIKVLRVHLKVERVIAANCFGVTGRRSHIF